MAKSSSGGGIGFIGVLFIVFLVLKLTGTIGWGWAWVLSPLWITALLIVLSIVLIGIGVSKKRSIEFNRRKLR
tara:strand:+ start:127 stop:345 length:219 start_codon:yes stop_codon:yes gene_type:complete